MFAGSCSPRNDSAINSAVCAAQLLAATTADIVPRANAPIFPDITMERGPVGRSGMDGRFGFGVLIGELDFLKAEVMRMHTLPGLNRAAGGTDALAIPDDLFARRNVPQGYFVPWPEYPRQAVISRPSTRMVLPADRATLAMAMLSGRVEDEWTMVFRTWRDPDADQIHSPEPADRSALRPGAPKYGFSERICSRTFPIRKSHV